jgi:hypothetical protein
VFIFSGAEQQLKIASSIHGLSQDAGKTRLVVGVSKSF